MFNKGQLAGLMKQAQAMQDNLKKAQELLKASGYNGEPVVIIKPTDLASISKLKNMGVTVDKVTRLRSMVWKAATWAPRRSWASAIWTEVRLVVPLVIRFSSRAWVPSALAGSAAMPASNSTATRVVGTVVERA